MNERQGFSVAGIPFVVACLVLAGFGISQLIGLKDGGAPGTPLFVGVGLLVLDGLLVKGFFQVAPNEGQVLQLFGKYAGTVRDEGLRWTNPFYSRRRVSLRVRNFESGKLKVNDSDGNPIEIAAVVVWQVLDTAEAVFCVDDYENFVHIQSESALRQMAQNYPYDAHDDKKPSLRSHGEVINNHLRDEIQARLEKAGVQVIEARISHLAYAQEIAQAMLQRQQANAIVAARERIVEGAVGMVAMALDKLREQGVVELDEERKAAMVSNLLVVLCGDRATQPVVNAGSLYN
ncbi:SPFH domain-containing protein [Dyella lutea]|uniref:SPFH domain-containing protein n=1 Tax=Dyella lutea TaxID=2950441 RepID=A0ABT1FDR2_9GAMM|nr:SPFH domain-containing protein [Dyella lutea]MCP1374372.1 SPFH domain-containing protein [Dyella lutea]